MVKWALPADRMLRLESRPTLGVIAKHRPSLSSTKGTTQSAFPTIHLVGAPIIRPARLSLPLCCVSRRCSPVADGRSPGSLVEADDCDHSGFLPSNVP